MNGADTIGLVSLHIPKWIVICFFKINERVSGSYRLFVSNLKIPPYWCWFQRKLNGYSEHVIWDA